MIEASSRLEVGAAIPMAPPPRDAEPRLSERRDLTGVSITVGDFQVGAATSFVKRPGKPPAALKWWRAVALSSLAATSFAAVLLLGIWRRAPEVDARPRRAPRSPAPPTWWTVPVGRNAAAKPAARRAPAVPSRPVMAADSAPDGADHHRRHRRIPVRGRGRDAAAERASNQHPDRGATASDAAPARQAPPRSMPPVAAERSRPGVYSRWSRCPRLGPRAPGARGATPTARS